MGAECRSCVQALAARLDALERDNYQAEEALGAGSDDEEFNLQGELAEGGCTLQRPPPRPSPGSAAPAPAAPALPPWGSTRGRLSELESRAA